MPSRNKKNKNRAQPTTSGTSAPKNGATPVKIGDDSGPSQEPEPKSDLKSTINVAREKLDQLQQTVDSIKASMIQSKVEKTDDAKPIDAVKEDTPEKQQSFETQTMKKKRNRNRNRNRNKNSQSNTTDESGMSSTSGTNENSTHENSPTPAVLTTIVMPMSDVITSEIKEEPTQIDINEPKVQSDIAENVVESTKKVQTVEVAEVQSSPKIEEVETKPIENKPQIDEPLVKIEELSTVENEKLVPIETPKIIESKENEPASKENKITDENIEHVTKESDKRTNEKQKKNRQAKNGNKNQKESPKADAEPKNQDGIKIESSDQPDNAEKIDKIETKKELPDVKKVATESKNKNNKTAKENKTSPKMNKKSPSECEPVETELKNSIVPNKEAEKKIDGDENVVQKVEEPKETPIESKIQLSEVNAEQSLTEQQPPPIEQIPLPLDQIQIEKISQESNVEVKPQIECAIKQDEAVVESSTIEPEIKEEIKQEAKDEKVEKNKPETHPIETKSAKSPSGPPKESKKSKGKKSPPQNKGQNEQKQNNAQEITPETKVEPVSEKKEELKSDIPKEMPSQETATIEPSKEIDVNASRKELAAIPEADTAKVDVAAEEKPKEVPNAESSKPTKKTEVTKGGNAPKEQIPSTSGVQSKTEAEPKKSELAIATSSNEVTKTPSTTPVLVTPAAETSKNPIQEEDATAKIWKILEEASKSLEPVEIEMDTPIISTIESIPSEAIGTPICSTKVGEQTKEETQELVTILETKEPILETKEPIKSKQDAQPKPSKAAKENNKQQTKQSSPTKTIDPQPKKGVDQKKKNTKQTKTNEPQKSSTPEKTPEKIAEQAPAIAETPPIVVNDDPVDISIEEIPLDVSIMPSEIEVAELNADSKNGQGSDFVPSVEQSAVETESLVTENDVKVEAIQSIPPKDNKSKSKSKSPINMKKEKAPDQTKTQPTISEHVQESKATEEKKIETVENIMKPPMESKKSQSKSPSKSVSPEKSKQSIQNNKQKEVMVKNAQGKTNQNNKKANGKPAVPPKPEHLVSSQAKKGATSKSESAVKSKTEKILVLTGNIEDDDSEDDYIEYKFMPRQVFISTICQACKKPTTASERVLCQLCHMVSYCCSEHGTNDEPIHKDLCAALQEIAKKRGGHIYNNARILNNNDYRSLRVHTLNLCENFVKRPLQTYEREILLFPRLCSTPTCREWRQNLLSDCPGCGQVFYCTSQPEHLIESHERWCKSVALYQKLVVTQSVSGRIEPSLPSRIQTKPYTLPNNIGDVFKDLYKNYSAIKDDCVFATLTQLATAPLTAYFATQKAGQQIGEKFTIHLIGAELQFEADVLDIWETFFLHLAHNLMELTIVFCGPELNAENIPLDIISRIRMCRTCRQNCRIVKFDFQCAKFYHDYAKSSAYSKPDLICFFNPGFHHINSLNGMDTWSETIKIASSSGCPVVVTSYTEFESPRDLDRFQGESTNGGKQMTLIHGPEFNVYSSQRPERNFISDEIVPLIFKNYFCFIMK